MFEVYKIMDRNITPVNPETHIYVAMNLLVKEKVVGLPVVDREMNLLGLLTENDVLRMLLSRTQTDTHVVRDYMSKPKKTFSSKDSAVDVCEYFMNNQAQIVPVLSDRKYVGIVHRRDIIFLILRIRGKIFKKEK